MVDIEMPLDIPRRWSNTLKLQRVGEVKRVDLPAKLQLLDKNLDKNLGDGIKMHKITIVGHLGRDPKWGRWMIM